MSNTPRAVASTALSIEEQQQLAASEEIIGRGLATFVEVGRELKRIHDAKLYRTEFRTFDEYCNERWKMDDRYARRLIASSEVVTNLLTTASAVGAATESGPIGPLLPTNESQVRPLTLLDPDEQCGAWQRATEIAAVEGQPAPRARHVEAAVEEVMRATEQQPYSDSLRGNVESIVIARGLLDESDLIGLLPEARAMLVWEIERADREYSIEYRDEHPDELPRDADPCEESDATQDDETTDAVISRHGQSSYGSMRVSRSVIGRRAREIAAHLRRHRLSAKVVQRLLDPGDALRLPGTVSGHADACRAFAKSIRAVIERVDDGRTDLLGVQDIVKAHRAVKSVLKDFDAAAERIVRIVTANPRQ